MAVLSVPAGLFLIYILHIGIFLDRLPESNLGLGKLNFNLVFIEKLAGNHLQMQVAHTIKKHLPVLGIIHIFHGQVFMGYLLERLGNLVNISLILRIISHVCIGLWHFPLAEFNSGSLGG
ncbi:hypothetical protein IMSAGC014_01057 [Bacteroidaceae bacterium]|nr:hypothetical protein IMSAGC014_01057 [Bacteroidaceae bacterium]